MKRSYFLGLFVIGSLGAFAACGGDDSGVVSDVDAGNDATVDNFVPPADTGTIDTGVDTGVDTGLADVIEGGTTLDGGSCGGAAVTVTAVSPQFAWASGTTPITITGTGFIATPKVYLRGTTGDAAGTLTQIQHVAFVSSTSITVVIPKDLVSPGDYELAVVNGNTCAGLDAMGIRIVAEAPPQVLTVTPAQATTSDDVAVTITGCGFANNATVSTVSSTGTVTLMAAPSSIDCSGSTTQCGSPLCTMQATIQAKTKTLAAGAYLVRVTNPTPNTFGEYSSFSVTNPSGNPGAWAAAATTLNIGRRSLGLVAGRVNDATRFLYAVGGETAAGAALKTIEVGPLDRFGNLGKWFVNKNQLNVERSGLAVVRYQQWIYALGGTSASNNGTKGAQPTGTPLGSIERAKILNPAYAPVVSDPPTVASGGGTLGAGTWYYKVSAINSDQDDPNGESIASDEVVATLSSAGKVTLSWTLATNGATPAGFKIYRSATADATSDSEVLIATIADGTATTFDDTGLAGDGGVNAEKPMPIGSVGQWIQTADVIGARLNFPAAIAPTPAGEHWVYISGGWGFCKGQSGTADYRGCVEALRINESTFELESYSDSGQSLLNARQRHAMAVMTKDNGPSAWVDAGAATDTAFLVVSGGRTLAGTIADSSNNVEYSLVGDNGALQQAFANPGSFSDGDGNQMAIANGYAYSFQGGKVTTQNGAVTYSNSTHQSALALVTSTTLTFSTFPSAGAALPTKVGRHGVAEESAFFYTVGGTTNDTDALVTVYRALH